MSHVKWHKGNASLSTPFQLPHLGGYAQGRPLARCVGVEVAVAVSTSCHGSTLSCCDPSP